MPGHETLTGKHVHTPFRWVFANEIERLASPVSELDLTKRALQTDDYSEWMLDAVTPSVTWVQMGGGGDAASISFDDSECENVEGSQLQEIIVSIDDQLGDGSGMWEFVSKNIMSASTTSEFTFESGYDYKIVLTDLFVSANCTLSVQLGTGTGPTYDTGNNYESAVLALPYTGVVSSEGATGADHIIIGGPSIAPGYPGAGKFFIPDPASTGIQGLQWSTLIIEGSGNYGFCGVGWRLVSGAAVTGIKFYTSVGNMVSGTFELYRRERNRS